MFFVFVGFKLVSELGAAGMGVNNWILYVLAMLPAKPGSSILPLATSCFIIILRFMIFDALPGL